MSLTVIGRGAVILGVINLIRLVAEFVLVHREANERYYALLSCDILLAAAAIFGGRRLDAGRAWAAGSVLFVAGSLFMSSLILTVWMIPYFLESLRGGGLDVNLAPRLVFYAAAILLCPYGFIVLLRREDPAWPPRGFRIACFSAGIVLSSIFSAAIIASKG